MPRDLLLGLQWLLLVIGVAALSGTAGVLVILLLMSCLFPIPRGENWGGAPAWMLGMTCGGVLAALAGAHLTVAWIGDHGRRSWRPATWVGIAAGLLVALALSARSFDFQLDDAWMLSSAFWIVICPTLGGFAAALLQYLFITWNRAAAKQRRALKRPRRRL